MYECPVLGPAQDTTTWCAANKISCPTELLCTCETISLGLVHDSQL